MKRRLDEEQESRKRADTIIGQLTQSNTALTDRLRELEAPSGQRESAEEAARRVLAKASTAVEGQPEQHQPTCEPTGPPESREETAQVFAEVGAGVAR